METGKQGDNSLRYIDINEIAKEIGDTLCQSLPGFHSFTGCDYTAAFFKKGKKRPLKILEKKMLHIKKHLQASVKVRKFQKIHTNK